MTRLYSDMGGVDFSGEPSLISPRSFAYLENMYRDYESGRGAGVETVPGYRPVTDFGGVIHAIHPHPERAGSLLVHAGKALYRFDSETRDAPLPHRALPGHDGKTYTVAERKSHAVMLDGRLYLADGERIAAVAEDVVTPIGDTAYVPTVYADGERYEQENLLTDAAIEEYHLFDPSRYRYYTERGMLFRITPEGLCLITGYTGSEEVLVLPARVTLGAREYAVAGVASNAFAENTTVRELIVSEGITMLEASAFARMRALTTAVLPSSLAEIPTNCFLTCEALRIVYLSLGLERISSHAFADCPVRDIHYAGTMNELFTLPGISYLIPTSPPEDLTVTYGVAYGRVRCFFPLHSPASAVESATLDGRPLDGEAEDILYRVLPGEEEGTVLGIYLEAEEEAAIYGKTLSIRHRIKESFAEDMGLAGGAPLTGAEAIGSSPLLAAFDGRLFVTGCPALPGVVFFSGRRRDGTHDASYFGRFNHFKDGDGRRPIVALISTPTTLLALMENAPGAHSVLCHEPMKTDDALLPRAYPVTDGLVGLGATSAATVFSGDPHFLSPRGLVAVVRTSSGEERRLVPRSSAVDVRLTREALAEATLFHFGSYLGIAAEGRVYLADGRRTVSREGRTEYEWYYLSGIGAYRGDLARYRYLSGELPPAVLAARPALNGRPLTVAPSEEEGYADGETVFSATTEDGTPFSYVARGELALPVTTDGERYGGEFCPATAFLECAGLLFFGADGRLFVFNTDKRDADGIIPRRYYSFAGHAYLSGCATKLDDCDLPTRRKTTVRSGGAVRLKAMTGGKVTVRVRTEEGRWREADTLYGGRTEFSETDFSAAEFHVGDDTVLPLREAERRWAEKQLYFVSEEYQRPFGLLSVAYQYRVAGRI